LSGSFNTTGARIFLLCCFVGSLILSAPSQSSSSAGSGHLALVGARIYPAPEASVIAGGVVLIKDGKITAVGEKGRVRIPSGSAVIDCAGLTLTAGFWNSHVHFTDPRWENAARLSSAQLAQSLQNMLTVYGFTTAFDTGSLLENTKAITRRIEAGEVAGPKIFSTGPGLVPKDGTPFYLKPVTLPEALTPEQAASLVRAKIKGGADAIKIFTGPTPVEGGPTLTMELSLVKAITAEAHRHGKPVFAHPEDDAGVNAAIDGGVDILAHTAPSGSAWNESQVVRMKRARISLIPTLSLFTRLGRMRGMPPARLEKFISAPLEQLRAYSRAGGQILFGTDIGFIEDYDPTEEYLLMARAGLSFRQILASLTTAPAAAFGARKRAGRIAPGMDADIVVLAGDPETDVRNLSLVKYTVRRGRIIYQSR
jgi:imidazolonepropionase-like amidohydrolase